MNNDSRDHLFISYADEDSKFAEWLSLKLASEGYKVWFDRIKLLGGESYPKDIDDAIKNLSFRLIAILSRHSISKLNPLKECTLGLSISRERGINFIIPINLDGLAPTELNWMTSDLTFVSFHESWAKGFTRLTKALSLMGAPTSLDETRGYVSDWLTAQDRIVYRPERIWTNLLPISEIPKFIRRYELDNWIDFKAMSNEWVFILNGNEIWAFDSPPKNDVAKAREVERINCSDPSKQNTSKVNNILSGLLKEGVLHHCLSRGMKKIDESGDVYFPKGLIPDDQLHFIRYDGKKLPVKAVGQRTFKTRTGNSNERYELEKYGYHLSPRFKPVTKRFGQPSYALTVKIHWLNTQNQPLSSKSANSKRKALCKDWWNYEWLSRVMAITYWLVEGKEHCDLLTTESGNLRIGGSLVTYQSGWSLDETQEDPMVEKREDAILEDEAEEHGEETNDY